MLVRRAVIRSALLVVAVSAGSVACQRNVDAAKREYLASGDRYSADQKWREASLQYRNAIQKDPRFGEAYLKLGDALLAAGDPFAALSNFVRAADLLPESFDANLRAGQLLLLSGKVEDAGTRADKAIALAPRSVDAQILKANTLAGLKDLNAAVSQIERAIELDPDRALTYANLGLLQFARGNRQDAENAFRRAVETDVRSIGARVALANFYLATDRTQLAEAELNHARGIEPGNLVVNRALAFLYVATNRVQQAEAPLKLIADETKDPRARRILAEYYQATGRTTEALAILDALAASDSSIAPAAIARKAGILYGSGKKADAYAAIDATLSGQPKNPEALLARAELLFADGKLDEALLSATAAASNGRLPAAHFTVAEIKMRTGDVDEAISSYLEALALAPSYVPARLQLARAYLTAGRHEEALHASEDALSAQPGNLDASLLKARALLAAGNALGAEQALNQLPARMSTSPVVQAQLGMLYGLKKDFASARRAFTSALDRDPSNVDALSGLASIDLASGQTGAAAANVDAVLRERPKSVPHLLLAAHIRLRTKNIAEAELLLRRTVDADPSNLQAYSLLGRVYATEGKLSEAQASYEALLKRKPNTVSAQTMVGILLGMQNKPVEARARYEKVLQLDPRAAVAANNLAMIHLESGGNLDVALQLAQTAKAQLPNRPEINDTLGLIYLKKGLGSLAVQPLVESVRGDQTNASYHYHLGLAYLAAGQKDRARTSIERALKLNSEFSEAADAKRALTELTTAKARS